MDIQTQYVQGGGQDQQPGRNGGEDSLYTPTRLNQLYLLAVIGTILFTLYYVTKYVIFSSVPLEDAAILMRYSIHLAQGNGIVWNIGDKPVDGGSDFLFMVILGLLTKTGLTIEIATRLLLIVSHLLTVMLVYLAIIRLQGNRWLALLSATFLAVGPASGYISGYFGTPFFALFACVTWYLANRLAFDEEIANGKAVLFALSSLVLGLIRPEGVLLAVFILLAIVYMRGFRYTHKVIMHFLATFLFLGGAYFLWRWHYFGYPLPNPFYKKGGGYLHLSSLTASVKDTLLLCGPFSLAFIIGLLSLKTFKRTIFLLIPVAGFTFIWVLLSNEANYLERFQYAVLPMVLISWPMLVKGFPRDVNFPQPPSLNLRSQLVLLAVILTVCAGILWYPHSIDAQELQFRDGRYEVAKMLSQYSNKHYTIATSEAGLIPLYSNWRDIDTWGLNDQWIAHHGQITEGYLDSFKPEIIMFHASFSPVVPLKDYGPTEEWSKNWYSMVLTLKDYAESHGYILAAAFGVSPYDTHYYFVKPDFPDSGVIVSGIRNMMYIWYATGEKSINYAQITP